MIVVADENVDYPVVQALRQQGLTVLSVQEQSPGIADDEVLALANRNAALLITTDKDFGELVFRQRRLTTGIVLLRLAGCSIERKCALTTMLFARQNLKLPGTFTVLSPHQLRQRSLAG